MREVEVKITEIDRDEVEGKLEAVGASRDSEEDVDTVFFDFPSNSIATAENLLRLRKKGDKNELTFKRFVQNGDAKVRDEYEVSVSDFETMRIILEFIGLVAVQRMKKHRISYLLKDGARVDLDKYTDEYSYIPDLMEIEAKDAVTLRKHVEMLGFKPEDAKTWTTFDLVNHYSQKAKT
jgi:predicted adenylyl cyclase CyaB